MLSVLGSRPVAQRMCEAVIERAAPEALPVRVTEAPEVPVTDVISAELMILMPSALKMPTRAAEISSSSFFRSWEFFSTIVTSASQASHGLGKLKTNIAASKNDQMVRDNIQF